MRDDVRGLLGPAPGRPQDAANSPNTPTSPQGLRHLLSHSRRDTDGLRDGLKAYVADHSARRMAC